MVYILLFIVSLFLYFSAPGSYELWYCYLCFGVFAFEAYHVLKIDFKRLGVLNFNTLFILSYFLCCYSFAVFIYPLGGADILSKWVDERSLAPCVGLATIGMSAYTFFYVRFSKNEINDNINGIIKSGRLLLSSTKNLYILISLCVIYVLYRFMTTEHEVEIEVEDSPFLFVFFVSVVAIYYSISFSTTIYKESLVSYFKKNKFVLLLLGIILSAYTLIGDRLIMIELVSVFVVGLSVFFKKISIRSFVLLSILGVFFMFSIRVTRGGDSSLKNSGVAEVVQTTQNSVADQANIGLWAYFSDLTGMYMTMCYGYQYTKQHGLQYPFKIIPTLFAPIPFVPNIISEVIYGIPLSATSPGRIIGVSTEVNVGGHCITSAYMPWGVGGIIILFSLFGILVSKITNNCKKNVYWAACYLTISAYAIFMPRSGLTDIYRPLVWSVVIIYILSRRKTIKQ